MHLWPGGRPATDEAEGGRTTPGTPSGGPPEAFWGWPKPPTGGGQPPPISLFLLLKKKGKKEEERNNI
jgi:hypothetical protein